MSKKRKKKPRKKDPAESARVSAALSPGLTEALDEEVERRRELRPAAGESRASVVRFALRKLLLSADEDPANQSEVRENLRTEAELMEAEAEMFGEDQAASRSLLLMAAAKEIESLSVLADPTEDDILGTLIRTIMLIRRGTGYRSLPRVPPDR